DQQVEHGPGDVLRISLGRMGVPAESGRGVDLDDGDADLAHGLGDVGSQEVDPGHVEPDHPGRLLGDLDVLVVSLDCPVYGAAAGRHVAGRGQPYDGVP